MKRFLALILAAATLLCLLSGCAAQNSAAAGDTAPFTDDLGRTVQLPKDLTRIAPSGSVASMVLATIALGERTHALRKPRLLKPRREQIPAGAALDATASRPAARRAERRRRRGGPADDGLHAGLHAWVRGVPEPADARC